jgi:hypothetical protein
LDPDPSISPVVTVIAGLVIVLIGAAIVSARSSEWPVGLLLGVVGLGVTARGMMELRCRRWPSAWPSGRLWVRWAFAGVLSVVAMWSLWIALGVILAIGLGAGLLDRWQAKREIVQRTAK